MVEQSAGMLAPVGSLAQEKYLTVSCGHTTQFMKALLAGCPSKEPGLADLCCDGKLQASLSSKDPELQSLLAGWFWTIVSNRVETQWPNLPKLAEQALNSSNKVFSGFSEIELLLQILDLASAAAKPNLGELAKQAAPAEHLQPLALQLAKWLESFSNEGHFLQFLKPFSKQYGENCNCGEDFWNGAVQTLPAGQLPMFRLAMVATQLTAPQSKVSNGVSRLLVRGDWEKLKSSKLKPVLVEAEKHLFDAWNSLHPAWDVVENVKHFGILAIRTCLFTLGKEMLVRIGVC